MPGDNQGSYVLKQICSFIRIYNMNILYTTSTLIQIGNTWHLNLFRKPMRNYSFHKGKTKFLNSEQCELLCSFLKQSHFNYACSSSYLLRKPKAGKKLHSTQNKCTRFVYVMVQWTKLEQMNSEQ